MKLRMIRYGMLAGLGFLLAVTLIERFTARPGGVRVNPGAGLDADVSNQLWHVLAEARKILEESA
jgi:hypothetical protein